MPGAQDNLPATHRPLPGLDPDVAMGDEPSILLAPDSLASNSDRTCAVRAGSMSYLLSQKRRRSSSPAHTAPDANPDSQDHISTWPEAGSPPAPAQRPPSAPAVPASKPTPLGYCIPPISYPQASQELPEHPPTGFHDALRVFQRSCADMELPLEQVLAEEGTRPDHDFLDAFEHHFRTTTTIFANLLNHPGVSVYCRNRLDSNFHGLLSQLGLHVSKELNITRDLTHMRTTLDQMASQVQSIHQARTSTSSTHPNPQARTYAASVAQKIPSTTSAPKPTANAKQTRAPSSEIIRYTVRFEKGQPPRTKLVPTVICDRIKQLFKGIPSAVNETILGAMWNQNNNCVLSFPSRTSRTIIETHADAICAIVSTDPKPTLMYGGRSTTIHLTSVPTTNPATGEIYSNEALYETLMQNPFMHAYKLRRSPVWLRRRENITSPTASVVFEIEDPTGHLEKELLRRTFFMFNISSLPKRWTDKPQLRQCSTCWKLDHLAGDCKMKTPTCVHCGGPHIFTSHRKECALCKADKNEATSCPHPPFCSNCSGNHRVDDIFNCPYQRTFRRPPRYIPLNDILPSPSLPSSN